MGQGEGARGKPPETATGPRGAFPASLCCRALSGLTPVLVAVAFRLVGAFDRHADVVGLLFGERGQLDADLLEEQGLLKATGKTVVVYGARPKPRRPTVVPTKEMRDRIARNRSE